MKGSAMTRLLRSRLAAAGAGALGALALAGGGYAMASGGGTISACVHKHTGVLYVGHCAHPLTWNHAGPQGPHGPMGATGQQGIQGPQGTPGTPGTGGGGAVEAIFAAPFAASNSTQHAGPFGGYNHTSGTATAVQAASPLAFTAQGIYASLAPNGPGNGGSYTVSLEINGTPSAVSCTIIDPSTSCQDTTHTASVGVGDQIDLVVVPSTTPAPTTNSFANVSVGAHFH
jgi:hypothetical protein